VEDLTAPNHRSAERQVYQRLLMDPATASGLSDNRVSVKDAFIRLCERAALRRRPTLLERAALRAVAELWPGFFETRADELGNFRSKRRVRILSPSDEDPDLYRRMQWADSWVKYELTKAIGAFGYLVTDVDPHVVIHLFGAPAVLPRSAFNVLWIYSHPERVDAALLARYHRIFCGSSLLVDRVRQLGYAAHLLWGATSRRPRVRPIEHDVIFVGNARAGRRQVVEDVGRPSYRFRVWGRGYRGLPERYRGGDYRDYCSLDDLYSSSLISLNDHAPEMATHGIVSARVFDILASGGFCISDANSGLAAIFGDSVPQYRSRRELHEMIDFYLRCPDERLTLMKRGCEIALSHTWDARASEMLTGMAPQAGEAAGNRHRRGWR
jgi:hypothetical protein